MQSTEGGFHLSPDIATNMVLIISKTLTYEDNFKSLHSKHGTGFQIPIRLK